MRDIDRIIRAVEEDDRIPPVHKRVLINRIELLPTQAELDQAAAEVYGNPGSTTTAPQPPGGETHLARPGHGLFVCCGRAPFELPGTDRMTQDAEQVTCKGRGDTGSSTSSEVARG